MSMKNPLTPAGIEPATFRFVAQHLNHCATAARRGPDVSRKLRFPDFVHVHVHVHVRNLKTEATRKSKRCCDSSTNVYFHYIWWEGVEWSLLAKDIAYQHINLKK